MTAIPSLTSVLASLEAAIHEFRTILDTELGSHNLPDEDEEEFEDRENAIIQLEEAIADLERASNCVQKVASIRERLSTATGRQRGPP